MADLTGQNIQDTYQSLLQVSNSGQITDGTGSLIQLLEVTASYAVSASHEITNEISSSYAQSASVAEKIQGALTIGPGLDLSNSAVNFTGEDARTLTLDLTEVISNDGANRLLTTDGDGTLTAESHFSVNGTELIANTITAGSNISSSGTITGQLLKTDQYIVGNTALSTELEVDGLLTILGNITGKSNISSSGTISGSKGHFVDGLTLGSRLNANQIGANGNVGNTEYGHLNGVTGAIQTQFNNIVDVTGSYAVTGSDILFNDITSSGNISASGDLTVSSASINKLHVTDANIVGQRHILWSSPVYINDTNGLDVDAGYFGSSVGNTRGNWNDATAAAFDSSAETFVDQVNITEDKQNKMFVAPFPISRIEVLASWRPQTAGSAGEKYWAGLWTGSAGVRLGEEAGQNNTNVYIGLVTGSTGVYYEAANFEGNNLDLDYTFPTPLPAHTQIFYAHGTGEAANVSQKNTKGHIQIMVYEA